MIICAYCGYKNRAGTYFCEDCGQDLLSNVPAPTLPTREFKSNDETNLVAKATWGTASLSRTTSIVMHVRDAAEPIILDFEDSIILGRADDTSTRKPEVDLTPYGALEMGVSRLHASIERSDDVLTLADMGSSNGTHLNGQRLIPDQPRVLRDGDEIRLGKLVAHIYFK